ncbi:hypothetical protein [Thermosulfurimonas sp. F29]|uniref:hypothetical protein n=1 Tax=Thermosulfurimonas sp. F29 TaxID=2867247 RepID=UPI001C831B80|nr:hypothetical protein [Thermosulfurimonas sp. F29]MBX6423379.1 hypothetical protein [Thermosulfurimonas sp. F29]
MRTRSESESAEPIVAIYELARSVRWWRRIALFASLGTALSLVALCLTLYGLNVLARRPPVPLAYSPDGRPYPALWSQRKRVLTIEVQAFAKEVTRKLFEWNYGEFLADNPEVWKRVIIRRLRFYYEPSYLKALAEGMVAGRFVQSLRQRRAQTLIRFVQPVDVAFKNGFVWARVTVDRTDVSAKGRKTLTLRVIYKMHMGDRSLENPWGLWIVWQQVEEVGRRHAVKRIFR